MDAEADDAARPAGRGRAGRAADGSGRRPRRGRTPQPDPPPDQVDGIKRIRDPRVLRAIAHPTRSRILSELWAGGPARAADLAQDLDIPANQASFHLRQLAKYGLVVEAPEQARDRRDRVWQVAERAGLNLALRDMEDAGGAAAVALFRRNTEAWAGYLVRRVLTAERGSSGRMLNDAAVRLTEDEASEFLADLDQLIKTWSRRTGNRDVERQTYSLLAVFQPYPSLVEASRGTGPPGDDHEPDVASEDPPS